MIADTLQTKALLTFFKTKKSFKTKDIADFYKKSDPDIKQATVNWRAYYLVRHGIISRVGKGQFTINNTISYAQEISPQLKSLNSKLKRQFPFLKICLWSTAALNEFMLHQPGRYFILAEAEKEATEPVFHFLKELNIMVFLEPGIEILNRYLPDKNEVIIVKSLVSEAPLQQIDGLNTASLEKMLVDIFCDEVIFAAFQGSEMKNIFKESFLKYSVNQNRMLRYADRRGKKMAFKKYLKSVQISTDS